MRLTALQQGSCTEERRTLLNTYMFVTKYLKGFSNIRLSSVKLPDNILYPDMLLHIEMVTVVTTVC